MVNPLWVILYGNVDTLVMENYVYYVKIEGMTLLQCMIKRNAGETIPEAIHSVHSSNFFK